MRVFGLPNDLLQALGLINVAFSFPLFPRECYLCDWLKNACCLLIADDNKSRTREEALRDDTAAQNINRTNTLGQWDSIFLVT